MLPQKISAKRLDISKNSWYNGYPFSLIVRSFAETSPKHSMRFVTPRLRIPISFQQDRRKTSTQKGRLRISEVMVNNMSDISKMKLDTLFLSNSHIHITSPAPEAAYQTLMKLYPDAYGCSSSTILNFREIFPYMTKNIDIFHFLLSKKMLILSLSDDDLKKDELWKLILFLLHTRKIELPERGCQDFRTIIVTNALQVYHIPPILLGSSVPLSELYSES